MRRIDRRVFSSRINKAVASFGSTENIAGTFFSQPREVLTVGGSFADVSLSFDCQYVPEIATLETGDDFVIEDIGTFRFLREVLPGGDESGLTIIELGENE